MEKLLFKVRAVERMMDFDRGPGKILKYDLKRGKFCSLGPPFEVWAPVKITASPPLSTVLFKVNSLF
jgi:hypothetical protein